MNLEVLISTMHQPIHDYSLLDSMNIQSDAVVVNQCDRCEIKEFKRGENKVTWIDTNDRGLSRSRNTAIDHATADICLLADDDEIILEGYKENIQKSFSTHPEIDIIRFKVVGIEKLYKKYQDKPRRINVRFALKTSSVELAFKRETIMNYGIEFDELIGAGTEFLMGEENAFIINCLRKGGKGWYEPVEIAHLHIGNSSWFTGYNEEYYFARGASYAAISKTGSYLLCIMYAIKHRNETDLSLYKTMILMIKGVHSYIRKKEGFE